ncbi:MAG: TetR/AcrR family transcriptional regulator [Deltaproteobacteria bacterium]|nr:TetR/AcrR family transcriptional regulator [Deltaproteobacteria bacterium]
MKIDRTEENLLPDPRKRNAVKGGETRQRILDAARSVFTRMPFRSASLRIIAEEAGVRHPLLLHYFGSKTALFDEVSEALEKEILESHPEFFEALRALPPELRANFYLNGVVLQGFLHPAPYRLLLLNAADAESPKTPGPGLFRMKKVQEKIIALARESLLGDALEDEASMLMLAFTLIVSQYVGAMAFHRNVLGLSAEDYKRWARETVVFLFEPLLREVSSGKAREAGARQAALPQFSALSASPLPGPPQKRTRGEKARQRILKAAKKVFSSHAYDEATIRMVGSAGSFDHSLIHHLYPSKDALFEAVARQAYGDFIKALGNWQAGLKGLPPDGIFRTLLQNGLEYCFENRDTIGLLTRNTANYEIYEHLSGFVHMSKVHSGMLDMAVKNVPKGMDAPTPDLNRWLYSVVTAGYSLAGAPDYTAGLLGVAPNSDEYRAKVFRLLYFVFAPSAKNLSGGSKDGHPAKT